MHNPLVSIIIPVYNSEQFLAETIGSAINQTWTNKEILLIDDGSTDDSLSIAKSYESDRIKVFHQENKGASAARNYGLREARGEYIQFLDADDLLSENKIETQLVALTNNPNKVAICSTVYFLDGTNHSDNRPDDYDQPFYYSTDDSYEFLMNLYGKTGAAGMITVHSWLTPRCIIDKAGEWNENLNVDDDGEYFCRVVLSSKGIIFSGDVFNYYRKHSTTLNLSAQKNLKGITSSLNALLLKSKHLVTVRNDSNTEKVIARHFTELCYSSYPHFKSISRRAYDMAKKYGGLTHPPYLGNKKANILTGILPWKLLLTIRIFYHKFLYK